MKRVLYLAYHFPPIGGGGVQRQLKLVRYLHDYGWQPTVITGPATASQSLDPGRSDDDHRGAYRHQRSASHRR